MATGSKRGPSSTGTSETLFILAFSGGGTRAAAFSYGVLEELRRTEIEVRGKRIRLLDEVDLITGVSGGSFTALAYALHGEKLFDSYEERFLKRNVQGELLARTLSPGNWPALWSESYGRSEMAAQLYDEILFGNATFGDLMARPGPTATVTATDISTGSRLTFTQGDFDLICSDVPRCRCRAPPRRRRRSRWCCRRSRSTITEAPAATASRAGRAPWRTRTIRRAPPAARCSG